MLRVWVYRAKQFFGGFRWAITPDEAELVRTLLTPEELALFTAMQARDRRHSMNVAHWLRRHTEPSRDLLAAALLHDVGKGNVYASDRIAYVVLHALSPSLLERLSSPSGTFWRRSLWTLKHHARIGAQRLEEIGADPPVIELVAMHTLRHEVDNDDLRWLIAADRAS